MTFTFDRIIQHSAKDVSNIKVDDAVVKGGQKIKI